MPLATAVTRGTPDSLEPRGRKDRSATRESVDPRGFSAILDSLGPRESADHPDQTDKLGKPEKRCADTGMEYNA